MNDGPEMGDLESGLSRAARRVSPIVAARYLMVFYFVLLIIPCIVFAVRLRKSMKKLSEEGGQYSHEDLWTRLLTDDEVSLPKEFVWSSGTCIKAARVFTF